MTTLPVSRTDGDAAPAGRRVLAQGRFELGTLLRNGEQLLVALVLPALVLVGLSLTEAVDLGSGRRVDLVVPGVLALCVVSSAFTATAIATGFDRRYGVLRLLGTTPLGRGGLLAGKALATCAVLAIQAIVVGGLGLALGWHPDRSGVFAAGLTALLGTWAFVALALLIAGTLRAEAVLALANLIWVLLLAGGGIVLPRAQLPGWLGDAVGWLPSGALGDGLRLALIDGGLDLRAALVLVAWGVLASALTARTFRWSD